MLKSRSKLLVVSSILTLLYGYMLSPSPEEVAGIQAFLAVFIIWPGFLLFQFICYGLFKNDQNHSIYVGLILLKTALFLIQPVNFNK
ncbi:hypothetical protein SAMN05421734_103184 [Pelagirhabdus alkalitolerans]|uniref:Uncharacterized protein n=1 Tax=Pelagirhabdus alkalitolerans TaxID=1612202 RepID=A0A1G6HR36_9BACI|nr:hypothetical protein [Pelagirhabdus alkalitolerans]SDB96739.1 hypothetical protein SAMN05421734_103184 [Pelagirhabdus alkalitolerans]